jgi:hypothetical protein
LRRSADIPETSSGDFDVEFREGTQKISIAGFCTLFAVMADRLVFAQFCGAIGL